MVRALLTDSEREALIGAGDRADSTRNTLTSRVRQKIDRMEDDADYLRKHRPEMYERLHDAVCTDEQIDERVSRLEEQIAELRAEHDDE